MTLPAATAIGFAFTMTVALAVSAQFPSATTTVYEEVEAGETEMEEVVAFVFHE